MPTRQLPAGAVCGGAGVTLFTRGTFPAFGCQAVPLMGSPDSVLRSCALRVRASRRSGAALRTLRSMQSSARVRRLHEWKVWNPPPAFLVLAIRKFLAGRRLGTTPVRRGKKVRYRHIVSVIVIIHPGAPGRKSTSSAMIL